MADTVRVEVPKSAVAAVLDGRNYPAKDGVAELPGSVRDYGAARSNILPAKGHFLSLSHTDLPELRCTNATCGRRKLALYGPVCAWCGATCVPLEEADGRG